jgi:hypothetical protein
MKKKEELSMTKKKGRRSCKGTASIRRNQGK